MYQSVETSAGSAKRWRDTVSNAARPYLFRLSLACTCSWLPTNHIALAFIPATGSLALALLSGACLWLYSALFGPSTTTHFDSFGSVYALTVVLVYILSAAILMAALCAVQSMRLYRLDCRRRLFALGFDLENVDPMGDGLARACRLLARSEPDDDIENPSMEGAGIPFEPSNTEWYRSLAEPVRWSGTLAQDHVISSYTMRITRIERVGGNDSKLVWFRGVGADLVDPFTCTGYACRNGGRVRLAWGHTYRELDARGRYLAFGDGSNGPSCEQRGVLTLDEHNNVALTGHWAIEFIRPSCAPPGSLLSGTLALTARCR